jgi:hypothetical protein
MQPTPITLSTDSAFIPLPSDPRTSIQTASCFGNNDPCSLAEHRVVIFLIVNKLLLTFRILVPGLQPGNAYPGSSASSQTRNTSSTRKRVSFGRLNNWLACAACLYQHSDVDCCASCQPVACLCSTGRLPALRWAKRAELHRKLTARWTRG